MMVVGGMGIKKSISMIFFHDTMGPWTYVFSYNVNVFNLFFIGGVNNIIRRKDFWAVFVLE